MDQRNLATGRTDLYYRASSYINTLSSCQDSLEVIRSIVDCVSSGTSSSEQLNEVYNRLLAETALQAVSNINSCIDENISRLCTYRASL